MSPECVGVWGVGADADVFDSAGADISDREDASASVYDDSDFAVRGSDGGRSDELNFEKLGSADGDGLLSVAGVEVSVELGPKLLVD